MLRLSQGSAAALGLSGEKQLVLPRTAYVMVGEGCVNDCAFCAQARSSGAAGRMLSRVSWQPADVNDLAAGVRQAAGRVIERICLQVVMCSRIQAELYDIVRQFLPTGCPISVSMSVKAAADARILLDMGVDRVSLPLDLATPDLYREYKGGDLDRDRQVVAELSEELGRVGTHLIVGLGETEAEAIEFLWWCCQNGVLPALFAFTPVPHTRLGRRPPPALGSYRRIQLARHLLWERHVVKEQFVFDGDGRLLSLGLTRDELEILTAEGRAFETSGCPGCNRPFYNERTTGPWYNYPRPLQPEEVSAALAAAEVT